ncbi:MAG: hypothetical protein ACLPV4_18215, partial [Solirubrobacteraceae bacterium]
MIGTYASAVAISVAAILLGRGICVLSGYEGSTWLSPAVGFAALMVVCEVAISLPGRGWTAVIAVVVLCAGAIWVGVRRRAGWPSAADGLVVAVVVLGMTTIPFLANARVGVLGISYLNDTHWHLFLAQGLLQPSIRHLDNYGVGYPLGPHAVAATCAWGLDSSVDKTLTGVLIATPVLTGLAALGALRDLTPTRRWLVAILAAMPYLAAAWYIQSAFKEPIMSLLLIGLLLALQVGRRERFAHPVKVLVPIAVLIAGVLYDYSYPGLVWPVAIVACWLVLELVIGGGWRRLNALWRGTLAALPAIGLGAVVFLVLVAPDLRRMYTFWHANGGSAVGTSGGVTTTSLANLAGPLSTLEGFNIWLWGDFRFAPPGALDAGALAGFAIILVLFAVVRAFERRDLAWLAAVFGCALVYAYAKRYQSPYVAAKAMAVPGPLLVIGAGGELMRQLRGARWRSFATVGVALAAVVYFALAFDSDFLVLRDAQVGPDNHLIELRSLRPLLHGKPTLVLFYDDYFKWELLGVPVSSPLFPSPTPVAVQPAKPWAYGQPLDFDSIAPAALDQFDYVITTRTTAQSQPPPNFHLVGTSASYEVWKRVGPTPPFQVLPESGQPGAILNCKLAAERRISREHGFAVVRPPPIDIPVGPMLPGQVEPLILHLPAGEWSLSLPFVSPQGITVQGAGLDAKLPPNLDRPGSLW